MNYSVEEARIAYEILVGRCSDKHWYNTRKALLDNGLDVTSENVKFIAQIRQIIPRSSLRISGLIKCYSEASKFLDTDRKIIGSEVVSLLRQKGISPHPSTVTRWFKACGGYRKNKEYSATELRAVIAAAFIYKATNGGNNQ